MSLSPRTIEIIKATAAPVATNAEAITTRMYEILFANFPETKVLFEGSNPDQHKKLAMAISAFAVNIDNLSMLSMAVEKMATTHVLKKIKPEHYPMVGESILKAIKDVLGDAANSDVLDAWQDAYLFLSNLLIAREKELYAVA